MVQTSRDRDDELIEVLVSIESQLKENTIELLDRIFRLVRAGEHSTIAKIVANLTYEETAKLITTLAFMKARQALQPAHVIYSIVEEIAKRHEKFFLPRFPWEMVELVDIVKNDPELVLTTKIVIGVLLGNHAVQFAKANEEVGL